MLLRRRVSKRGAMPEMNVNITSLMDVMTVLLFFLVKSFTVSALTLSPPEGIRLPASFVEAEAKESLTVSLSAKELIADNKVLMRLEGGRFPASAVGPDGRTLLPLKKVLDAEGAKRRRVYAGARGEHEGLMPPGKILIQADRELPFASLKFLLHTAASSDYADYQFVIIQEEK